jgi:cob(I)alamin adenosyltransferase
MTDSTDPAALVAKIDQQVSHLWMVRTFLKHSDEATDDEELAEVHRELYDFMLAVGPSLEQGDYSQYLHLARKKLSKLQKCALQFEAIQPEVSGHMNFRMSARSLRTAVDTIGQLLNT